MGATQTLFFMVTPRMVIGWKSRGVDNEYPPVWLSRREFGLDHVLVESYAQKLVTVGIIEAADPGW